MSLKGAGPKAAWTTREEHMLREAYLSGGLQAARLALPERTVTSIRSRVVKLGLKVPARVRGELNQRFKPDSVDGERTEGGFGVGQAPIDAVLLTWSARRFGSAA